jgi:hypothetical protein
VATVTGPGGPGPAAPALVVDLPHWRHSAVPRSSTRRARGRLVPCTASAPPARRGRYARVPLPPLDAVLHSPPLSLALPAPPPERQGRRLRLAASTSTCSSLRPVPEHRLVLLVLPVHSPDPLDLYIDRTPSSSTPVPERLRRRYRLLRALPAQTLNGYHPSELRRFFPLSFPSGLRTVGPDFAVARTLLRGSSSPTSPR